MTPSRDHLVRLARLRDLFLDEGRQGAALPDYWRSAADLESYDRVFAARIGWKWDAALAECKARGMPRAEDAVVLDYGCGTGIAARRFAARFGAREVLLHDRSGAAMAYAQRAFAAALPPVQARALADASRAAPDVLLVSHVLGELDAAGRDVLHGLLARAGRVIVVEPGNRATSRLLSELRERLLPKFRVIAPCTHAARCPALERADDWCHFFAAPPPQVFTDGEWARTARELGIDLRALPYAFLALERGAAAVGAPKHRLLGRPRVGPHDARVQVCTEGGLATVTVSRRRDQATWRALKKHPETVRALPDEAAPSAE